MLIVKHKATDLIKGRFFARYRVCDNSTNLIKEENNHVRIQIWIEHIDRQQININVI